MDMFTNAAYLDDNSDWWIQLASLNAVFYCKKNGENCYVGSLKGNEKALGWKVGKIIEQGDYIYFFSRYEYVLWRYSKEDKKFEMFKYLDENVETLKGYELDGENVWIFPNNFTAPIIKLRLSDFHTKKISGNCGEEYEKSLITRTIYSDDVIYYASRNETNVKIGIFNTKNESIDYIDLPFAKYANCIDVFDGKIWVLYQTTDNRRIVAIIDISTNDIKQINLPQEVGLVDPPRYRYFRMFVKKNKIFLIGTTNYMVEMYDVENGTIEFLKETTGPFEGKTDRDILRIDIQVREDLVYIFSPTLGRIQVLDTKEQRLSAIEIDIAKELRRAIVEKISEGNAVKENEFLNLSRFLDAVVEA